MACVTVCSGSTQLPNDAARVYLPTVAEAGARVIWHSHRGHPSQSLPEPEVTTPVHVFSVQTEGTRAAGMILHIWSFRLGFTFMIFNPVLGRAGFPIAVGSAAAPAINSRHRQPMRAGGGGRLLRKLEN